MVERDRFNPAFGELNPIKEKQIRTNYDPNTSTFIGALRKSTEEAYKAIFDFPNTWKGIVLRVNKPSKCQAVNSIASANSVFTTKKPLITVNVRIPELHVSLVNPLNYGSSKDPSQKIINLYPEFIALNEEISNKPVSVGDIAIVTFGNVQNFEDPLFLGVVYSEPSPGVVGQTSANATQNLFNPQSSLLPFDSVSSPIVPEVSEETSSLTSEPESDAFGQTYVFGKKAEIIELVEMPSPYATRSGVYVKKEFFNDILQMLKDAHAAGHKNLKLSDGFREYNKQLKLYNQYKNGERKDPAANPRKSGPKSHLTGVSYDFAGTNRGKSAAFVWMANNAAKYGLWNSGKNFSKGVEAWHWEYEGVNSPIVSRYANLTLEEKRKVYI